MWFKWVIVSLLSLGSFLCILQIGKPRQPTTPGIAATSVIINMFLAVMVIIYWN